MSERERERDRSKRQIPGVITLRFPDFTKENIHRESFSFFHSLFEKNRSVLRSSNPRVSDPDYSQPETEKDIRAFNLSLRASFWPNCETFVGHR